MTDKVIELSVEETNKLRAKLGLSALRGVVASLSVPEPSKSSEVLELSVEATNDLREKLGLKPLKVSDGTQSGKTASEAFHKPAENDGIEKELQARLERAKLEREVRRNIQEKYSGSGLGNEGSDALSWAMKMRLSDSQKQAKKALPDDRAKSTIPYSEKDLEGMNVSHAFSDFEAGSTVVLTLADSSLLEIKEGSNRVVGLNDAANELENIELSNAQQQRDGIFQKRQVELGMGRAGGYAGYDDDEFEELGGVSAPSKMSRGRVGGPNYPENNTQSRGFQIGQAIKEDTSKNDMFSFLQGKAISLEPSAHDTTVSDFLTVEEYEATLAKKRKKDMTFKSKSKSAKKEKSKNKRKKEVDDDDVDEIPVLFKQSGKGLLAALEATAMEGNSKRKRRRPQDDEDEEADRPSIQPENTEKRAKYDKVMAKGNARAAAAFKVDGKQALVADLDDEEPDDAFLNAALAKARRLRKLKEISAPMARGADAIAEAVLAANKNQRPVVINNSITFAIDETREFTRALRMKEEQVERQNAKKASKSALVGSYKPEDLAPPENGIEDVPMEEESNMEELAKDIKDEEAGFDGAGFDGTTASVIPVGRGLSNVLSMLKHTGEIVGKNAKEEMRGRAKDERTYEDYENLDLKKVVQLGARATEKDREFANREIKLEYRDEHGRLLTRKEAYRNLCYQFHGHGSNKKNQERKLRQVEREQAEARLASRQVGEGKAGSGSLGALKATQRATGKAFVLHKT